MRIVIQITVDTQDMKISIVIGLINMGACVDLKVDPLSLVKDIQWQQYVRWRRQQNMWN